MDGEKNSTRRCGKIGEGDDDEISMEDFLKEQARLKADADAVLGASDSKNCTYPEGYLPRQALYACATCSPDGPAGVCLACSYECHEGHDLYELYTKRNFRCDCGNEKFKGTKCKLYPNKSEPNSKNSYNQNFRGAYCSCSRPYPDPEDEVEDEMIQCVICEDWHHGRHLETPVPEKEFSEMVCPGCMSKYSFLWCYQVMSEETLKLSSTEETCDNVDVESEPQEKTDSKPQEKTDSKPQEETDSNPQEETDSNPQEKTDSKPQESCVKSEVEVSHKCEAMKRGSDDTSEGSSPKKLKTEDSCDVLEGKTDIDSEKNTSATCLLQSLQSRTTEQEDKATFWSDGWRQKLCRCEDCMEMYEDKRVEFLLDDSDTVQAYEERGRNSDTEEEENEANVLEGMGRVQQIEVVRGIVDMKTQLNEFLEEFQREGKVVTEADIRGFFESLEQKRRQRNFMPQPHCR